MAKFINISPVTQMLYNFAGSSFTVKPGESIDSEKLGYEPKLEEGFKEESLLQKIFKTTQEAPSSKVAIPVSRIEPGAPMVQSVPGDPNFTFDEVNAPSTTAAIKALMEGKKNPDMPVIPTEKDKDFNNRVRSTAGEGLTQQQRDELLSRSPNQSSIVRVDSDDLGIEDVEVTVVSADPILNPTVQELQRLKEETKKDVIPMTAKPGAGAIQVASQKSAEAEKSGSSDVHRYRRSI